MPSRGLSNSSRKWDWNEVPYHEVFIDKVLVLRENDELIKGKRQLAIREHNLT